jgi:hypothetical protein
MLKIKKLMLLVLVMALAPLASAEFVLSFDGTAGDSAGHLRIRTDGGGGWKGVIAIIADNETAVISPDDESKNLLFGATEGATALWTTPADPYNGYVGIIGGFLDGSLQFTEDDTFDYSTAAYQNQDVMWDMAVEFTEETTFMMLYIPDITAPDPQFVSSVTVPEPATIGLLAMGALGMIRRRKSK